MTRKRVGLTQLHDGIGKLPLEQQQSLYEWLGKMIEAAESQEIAKELTALPTKPGRKVVDTQQVGKVVYRHEAVCCGKDNCKCASGELHGPYWYAYQRQQGKLKSWYVGKELTEKGKAIANAISAKDPTLM